MSVAAKGRAVRPVSSKNRLALWTRAAGRCQYEGCNEALLGDLLSGRETLNKAFVAHIVAAAPDGPRGHPVLSYELADKLENVMLLCNAHHRLIDEEDVEGHPASRLQAMKLAHETRIATVTQIEADRSTLVLLYAARIGEHDCLVSPMQAKEAVIPDRYPAEAPLRLELINCAYKDSDPRYWEFQADNLRSMFERNVRPRLQLGTVRHVSVFGIAPQPLLVELGRLLSDIADVDVFQLGREPRGWRWREGGPQIALRQQRPPATESPMVALKLAVSAPISDDRVHAALGDGCAIWSIDALDPGNDVLRRRQCLANFRLQVRATLAAIAQAHPSAREIHVFPALPVAMAVEFGRVWMPKADLPLVIWDEDRTLGGFQRRLQIGSPVARPSENLFRQAAR